MNKKDLDIVLMPNGFYHIFDVWHDLGEQFTELKDAENFINGKIKTEKVQKLPETIRTI